MMADVELVIKIPEEEYRNICLMSKDGIGMALYDWIANGTPLPKWHGRLIDESKITKCEQIGLFIIDGSVISCLKTDAPTIIEADIKKWRGRT